MTERQRLTERHCQTMRETGRQTYKERATLDGQTLIDMGRERARNRRVDQSRKRAIDRDRGNPIERI